MLRLWFVVVAVFVLWGVLVDGKLCEEVSAFNDLADLEKNLRGCQVIVGYLKIVLMEHTRPPDFRNITFPELTEIKGFLLVYRVYGLTSLGKLFPNLTVIRGLTLMLDYSLVLYDVPHLQEIGLVNLKYIPRGSIKIAKCNNLCYVHTIDWSKIASPTHRMDIMEVNDKCDECPEDCNGHCWNQELCQETQADNNCHHQCIGCTGPTADKCLACRNYKDNQMCVSECPANKYLHTELATCVSKQECRSLLKGNWWIFNHKCVKNCPPGFTNVSESEGWCKHCGDRCVIPCEGGQVDSIQAAQERRGCTHVRGDLLIKVNSKSMADELEECLGDIEEIDNFLKIYRSPSLTSLGFLKKLRVIHGNELENRRYSLIVFENPNLQKLWDNVTLTIKSGGLFFHYNPQLCPSEIDHLVEKTKLPLPTAADVSPFSNGDKTACNYIELQVSEIELTSTNITLSWRDVDLRHNNSILIGYLLYYIHDPLGNITVYDERNECDENGWNSIFVSSKFSSNKILSNNTVQVINLKPFTQYAYYVRIYTSTPSTSGQTKIRRFITSADDPTIPVDVQTISSNSDSITLIWKPPENPNGILSYYILYGYYEKDDSEFISQRNYCFHSHHIYPEDVTEIPNDIWSNSTLNSTCCKKEEIKATVNRAFESLCDELEIKVISDINLKGCNSYMYMMDDEDSQSSSNESTLVKEIGKYKSYSLKKSNVPEHVIYRIINDSSLTSYELKPLEHFGLYILFFRACNNESKCSSPVMVPHRTLKMENADDIPNRLLITVDNYNAHIKWYEPKTPNSLIVSYNIEYRRIDLEHSKTVIDCITRQEYMLSDYGYVMRNFLPGQYAVRVQSVSLAGIGRFSEIETFEISQPSHGSSPVIVIVPTIIILFTVIGGLYYYHYRYKKKHKADHLHLIATINPDYAGPVYIEDEWEIDRNDIEISNELGQGTFGMVHNGLIKSRNRPCAVKTVNENTNVHERMVFLNEASVMKAFSEAHHVVKLLGVVSRGEPPLVVMELMARGDLKSFLRRSRDSSNTITCAEMYRMAAEIADGMMYLAAKKFVHRDLAARNCMVAADHTVKIGDFGMTRDIYETDYYRKETRGLMPVRWMSPESLADGVFTTDSDVWSYGVVLWEMATLAEQPYQGLANEQVLQFVIAQGTLDRPPECPDLLYEIMAACWKWRPNHRPMFRNIVEKLESHVGQNFRLVSFYHSAEGEEYRMNMKERVYNPPALTVPLDGGTVIHWNTSDDDVSLYSLESNRPTPLLSSFQHQSKNMPSGNSYR